MSGRGNPPASSKKRAPQAATGNRTTPAVNRTTPAMNPTTSGATKKAVWVPKGATGNPSTPTGNPTTPAVNPPAPTVNPPAPAVNPTTSGATTPWSEFIVVQTSSNFSVPGRFLVPNFHRTYYVYDDNIEGTAGGTLIHFSSREEALQAARALKPLPPKFLQPVKIVDPISSEDPSARYLLFPELLVTWTEWIEEILRPERAADVGEMALSVFGQVYKTVRSRFDKKDSFPVLRDAFGITKDNRVVFVAPPTGGEDLHDDIMELSTLASELADMLKQIVKAGVQSSTIDSAIALLEAYYSFIKDMYQNWMPHPIDHRENQWFALNHPVYYDDVDTLRLFNNLGRLADKFEPIGTNLSDEIKFYHQIKMEGLDTWRENVDVAIDGNFKKILEFPTKKVKQQQVQGAQQQVPANNWKYKESELPLYVSNSMKHYWQHAGASNKLTRLGVISSLSDILPGLISKLYAAYAFAVYDGGYVHGQFDSAHILSKDI